MDCRSTMYWPHRTGTSTTSPEPRRSRVCWPNDGMYGPKVLATSASTSRPRSRITIAATNSSDTTSTAKEVTTGDNHRTLTGD